MATSGKGTSPEVGRPRGAAWRALLAEGIAWEGQVTIAGEHGDLHARLLVTGQRLVFVRNGAVALDAQRDWLDPAPVLGRDGRLDIAISTPHGSGPITLQLRSKDGKFGATRLLAKLVERPHGSSPFSGSAREMLAGTRRQPARRPAPPASHPTPPARAALSGANAEPPASLSAVLPFGVPSFGTRSETPPALPSPSSFGVAGSRSRTPSAGQTDEGADNPARPDDPSRSLSVAAVNRAFDAAAGREPAPADVSAGTAEAVSPVSGKPVSPAPPTSRWTLASELLARTSQPVPLAPGKIAPSAPTGDTGPSAIAPAGGTTRDLTAVMPIPNGIGPASPATPIRPRLTALGVGPRRADPVEHARPQETMAGRDMMPGLPASGPTLLPTSDRPATARNGRVAGNAVVNARSAAAAREAERRKSTTTTNPTSGASAASGKLSPSAVELASARAGVAPTPLFPAGQPHLAETDGGDADAATGTRGGRWSRLRRATWAITALALIVLTTAAALYLTTGLPGGIGDGGNGNHLLNQPGPSGTSQAAFVAPPVPTATVTATTTPVRPTATLPRGVGGDETSAAGLQTTTVVGAAQAPTLAPVGMAPSASDQPAPSDQPTAAPTDVPTAAPTATVAVPTATTEQPTATTMPPTVTIAPTVTTVPSTATATSAPTATTMPTETPVPPTNTAIPPTNTPAPPTATTVPPTKTPVPPTETPAPTATTAPTQTPTVAPTPTVESQPATVPDDGVPQQVFVAGSVRYTVESAEAGPTLPDINQPQSPFGGDWLAFVVYADNWGNGDAIIDMTQFTATIASSQETRKLDSYSEVIAIRLGWQNQIGSSDQVTIKPGEGVRLGLLFLTGSNPTGVTLNIGNDHVDMDAAFRSSTPMNQLGDPPAAPKLQKATVKSVIDGTTISVEADGKTMNVRYLGVTPPGVKDCYSGEALIANQKLVAGQTVWLERENINQDKDGAWLRDVWVESDSGSLELVSNTLASQGTVSVDVQRPNSRYAAYLYTTQEIAQYNGSGQWGKCTSGSGG